MLQRVKEVQESDLRMNGALARNIQRVLAVTQAQIDAAAAQGQSWFVKPVVKVSDPLDNLRGGTQLVIKQNSILPGQNVMRVIYRVGQAVVVGPDVPPLSLPDATANDLLSLTAFGGTSQASTPTPADPVDIVCNNGVLKARHESGLPLGYTAVEYIQSSGSQYIDTLRVPNNDDIIEQRFQRKDTTSTTQAWYGSMPSSSQITPRVGIGCFTGGFFGGFNSTAVASADLDTNVHTLKFWCPNATTVMIEYDGVELERPQTSAVDCYDPPVAMTSYLFARHGTNGVQTADGNGTKIYYHKEYLANGTLVLNMVPCKNASNVLGMYDLVSGQFFVNQGTGDFTAGDPVSDPVEIYTDGTVETIAIKDDQNATVSTATCEDLLSIGTYTDQQEIIDGTVTRKVGVLVLDGTENWTRATNQDGSANYVFYTQIDDKKVGKNQPMLCSHHEYIGSGSYVTLTAGKFLSNSANTSVYFDGGSITTATNWKNWLATQYANGTPVIVIYPLATETTETVTGQPMQTAAGNNTAEITQAGMAGLELEVEYLKDE